MEAEDFETEMTEVGGKYPEYDGLSEERLIEEYNKMDELFDDEKEERFKYLRGLIYERVDLPAQDSPHKSGRLFWGRYLEYRDAETLFDSLGMEDECKKPKFVNWLMDKKAFSVKLDADLKSYKFEYYGYGDGGSKPFRRFESTGGEMDAQDHVTFITEIREYYDRWRRERLNKILKKAGIATAIGVSLVSVITGLSLGLKRSGKDMVRDSKEWSELEHSENVIPWYKHSEKAIPWYKLEEASGKWLIILGDNIYLVIGGVCVGVYLYRKK